MASLLPLLRLHNGVSISPDRSPLRLHFSTAKLLARAVPPHSPSLLCPPWPDHTAISKLLLTMASTWPNLMPTSLCSASHQHAPQPSITTLCKYFLLWFKDATIFPWGASARPLAFIAIVILMTPTLIFLVLTGVLDPYSNNSLSTLQLEHHKQLEPHVVKTVWTFLSYWAHVLLLQQYHFPP